MSGTIQPIVSNQVPQSGQGAPPPAELAPAESFVSGSLLKTEPSPIQVPPTLAAAPPPDNRGLAIICVDGLSYPNLKYAIQAGLMPNLEKLIQQDGYQVQKFFPGLPCVTPASMCGFTLGDNARIPSFVWYSKADDRTYSAESHRDFHPGFEVPTRDAGLPGLLSKGAVEGCLASGGAPRAHWSIDALSQAYLKHGLAGFGASAVSDALRFAVKHPLRFLQSMKPFVHSIYHNVRDGGSLFGAVFSAVETDLCPNACTEAIRDDMKAGVPIMFIDLPNYDANAHHHGPRSAEALAALRNVDENIGRMVDQAKNGDRKYDVAFVSDHGQSQAVPFSERQGKTLPDLVTQLVNNPNEHIEMGASGSLANIYFKSDQKQWQLQDVQAHYPDLIPQLVDNPDIDLVATRQGNATVVYGKGGAVVISGQQAKFYGQNILGDHGSPETTLAQQLDRLAHMPNSGDIIVFGKDLHNDTVVAFDENPGSHGGIGGGQNQAMFLSPRDWHTDSSDITNSSQMYWVFRSKAPLDGQPGS